MIGVFNCKTISKGVVMRFDNKNKLCSVDNCTNKAFTRGFCKKHYARWYKHGDPLYVHDNSGTNNPMYKHGRYCQPSLCECGREKDLRSKKCSICSGISFPLGKKFEQFEHYDVTEEEIKVAVNNSKDFVGTTESLGISRSLLMRKLEEIEDIDISHFNAGRGRPLDYKKILVENSRTMSGTIKKYVIENELIPYICSECGLEPFWNEKPLTLHLHHISGDSTDNRIENLTFLCPNCHSQTDTYTGRNSRKEVYDE
jgi:hypothetical protein